MRSVALACAVIAAACGGGSGGPVDGGAGPDAPLAACGIPEPGTRCEDETTLERCDGTEIVAEDCAAQGAFCGPDPTAASGDAAGSACIRDGDPCGWIDYYGACSGTVLVYCSNGSLSVSDCSVGYGICAYQSAEIGYNCTTECAIATPPVTAEGECDGNTILRCEFSDGQYHAVAHDCPAGTVCDTYAETGWPTCLPNPPCSGVGPQGRCSGDSLVTCSAGVPTVTDCADTGRVCGYGGDDAGYVCGDPGDMGANVVSGTVEYEDRPPLPTGGLGPIGRQPARGAAVAVIADDDGAVLAVGVTADDGSYTLRYDADGGEMVHVLVATTSHTSARPIRVVRPDGFIHGFGGASFAAAATREEDVLVTDFSGLSEAFNVFDMLVLGVDAARDGFGLAAPESVFAQWTRGASDGTYYWDAVNGIFLLGEVSDDDGYDDAVIIHELGHHIEDAYGRSDSPGGAHDGTPTDPRLAWSEGFATWYSSMARENPIYMDSNAGGGWSYDLEGSVTTANPGGAMSQDVSEDMVSEILWDVGDAPGADDDPLSAADQQTAVLRVCDIYLAPLGGPARGVTGVDLVDWLDGWFETRGLGSCAAMRDLVEAHTFPYDFSGPAGACPP